MADKGRYKNNLHHAYEYLKKNTELSEASIRGLLGNLMEESTDALNPAAVNASEGAYGIAQWRLDRLDSLRKKTNWNTLEGQLEFLVEELQTPRFKKVYEKLKTETNVAKATKIVMNDYEVAAPDSYSRRLNNSYYDGVDFVGQKALSDEEMAALDFVEK